MYLLKLSDKSYELTKLEYQILLIHCCREFGRQWTRNNIGIIQPLASLAPLQKWYESQITDLMTKLRAIHEDYINNVSNIISRVFIDDMTFEIMKHLYPKTQEAFNLTENIEYIKRRYSKFKAIISIEDAKSLFDEFRKIKITRITKNYIIDEAGNVYSHKSKLINPQGPKIVDINHDLLISDEGKIYEYSKKNQKFTQLTGLNSITQIESVIYRGDCYIQNGIYHYFGIAQECPEKVIYFSPNYARAYLTANGNVYDVDKGKIDLPFKVKWMCSDSYLKYVFYVSMEGHIYQQMDKFYQMKIYDKVDSIHILNTNILVIFNDNNAYCYSQDKFIHLENT